MSEEINKTEEIKDQVKEEGHKKTKRNLLSQKGYLIFFVVLALVILGLIFFQISNKANQKVKTVTINKQVLQKRSKDLGLISRGLTGKAVDVNTGRVVVAARIFSPDDKTVYLELDLLTAPKGTAVDYIRYKEGRYVDHGEVVTQREDTKNILFNWTITKIIGNSRDGKWKIATYANGILSKRISYEIKSSKISQSTSEDVSPSDSDYKLNKTLASLSTSR